MSKLKDSIMKREDKLLERAYRLMEYKYLATKYKQEVRTRAVGVVDMGMVAFRPCSVGDAACGETGLLVIVPYAGYPSVWRGPLRRSVLPLLRSPRSQAVA